MEHDIKTVIEQCRNVLSGIGMDTMSCLGDIHETMEKILESLETLPKRMCDEMESREEIKKQLKIKEIQQELEFHNIHAKEINKMMYGFKNMDKE